MYIVHHSKETLRFCFKSSKGIISFLSVVPFIIYKNIYNSLHVSTNDIIHNYCKHTCILQTDWIEKVVTILFIIVRFVKLNF